MSLRVLRRRVGPLGVLLLLGGIAIGLVVGSEAFGQSITSTSDVRIVAQKLEDGRIEFGLEQDGERILPRTRFLPADARVGRWLKSSAIAVSVEWTTADQGQVLNPHPSFGNLYMLEPGNYDWTLGFAKEGGCTVTHRSGRTIPASFAGSLFATTGIEVERGASPVRIDWPTEDWSEDWNADGVVSLTVSKATAVIGWSTLSWPGDGYSEPSGACQLVHSIERTSGSS